MNRRFFLASLAASVASAALDPERALWIPGKKLISIPKPSVHRVHHLVDAGSITFEEIWVRKEGRGLLFRGNALIESWPIDEAPVWWALLLPRIKTDAQGQSAEAQRPLIASAFSQNPPSRTRR